MDAKYGHSKALAQEMASTWQGVVKVLAGSRQALSRPMEQLRSSLGAGKEQLRSRLEYAQMRVLRYAAILILMMVVGMNTAWGGTSYSNCTESVQI